MDETEDTETVDTSPESALGDEGERYSFLISLLQEAGVDTENDGAVKRAIMDAAGNPFQGPVLTILLSAEIAEVAQEQDGNVDLIAAYSRLKEKAEGLFPLA